jgi:hypothetical protein
MVTLFLLIAVETAYAQQFQEVPGDNFSLQGALEIFKKSASPEEFERMLNSPQAKVNNLDLNGDGGIDYIRVIDRNEGRVHAFILQAVISERESQDIAVIELEKLGNGNAVLQITGDADIYGTETIIEPTQEVRINAGTTTTRSIVNVWTWPSVQYVYGPYYSRWNSPWSWHHRPYWWNPWRPTTYIAYYPHWESYYPNYTVCNTHRIRYAQSLYRPYRSTSVVVYNRHQTQITNYRSANATGNTRGRDSWRDDDKQRGNSEHSRSVVNEHRNSGSANTWQQNDSRSRAAVNPFTEHRRNSSVIRDESTIRTRSTPEVYNTPATTPRNSWAEPRNDSRNRSNQITTNQVQIREFRSSHNTRNENQITPQLERRHSDASIQQLSGSGDRNNSRGNKSGLDKRARE